MQSIPLYLPGRSRRESLIGWIHFDDAGKPTLVKRYLNLDQHHMRHPPGWALAAEHIEMLRNYDNDNASIELHTTDGGFWWCTLATFLTHCHELRVANKAGYERQLHLRDQWWKRNRTSIPKAEPPTQTQMSL